MFKVLRITTEVNRSSIGRTTEQLGQLVIQNGGKSYIAYGRRSGISKSQLVKIGNKINVYSHCILTRLFDAHGLGSYFSTRSFINKIRAIQPDLIHLHDIHGYYINYKLLFSFLKCYGKPIVWTQHDCWAYTGHCAHYTQIDCQKWRQECSNCPQKHKYPKSFFDRSIKNYRDKKKYFTMVNNMTIVTVSEWMKKEVEKSFLKKYPIKRIYNGIDTKLFYPHSIEENQKVRSALNIQNKIMLLAVATAWSDNKGFKDYVELSKLLDDKYIIVLLGLPDYLRKRLPKNVIGLSRTDNIQDLSSIYSAANIVLNLSKEESFGKTTVEGLACGIPGIVYNTTASPELLDSTTGVVVENGDISAVYEAIIEIEKWDKENTSRNCRERALKYFDMQTNFSLYIQLYKELIDNVR